MTDILSPSPYAYLDGLTPADRQAEIARRQHSRREEWCDDARRARDYQARIAGLEADASNAFVQGCVAGSVVSVLAIICLWIIAPYL